MRKRFQSSRPLEALLLLGVISLTVTSCTSSGGGTIPKAGPSKVSSSTGPAIPSSTSTGTTAVAYDRSCEKTAQTQVAMDSCVESELTQLQTELSSALSKERNVIAPDLVDAAEAAFVRYETSECDAAASPSIGGSIHPLVEGTCQVALTVQRIQQVTSDTLNASGH